MSVLRVLRLGLMGLIGGGFLCLLSVTCARAASDPCKSQEDALDTADRNLNRANNNLETQIRRLSSTQEQVANRTASYEIAIINAQSRAAMMRANASTLGANCVTFNLRAAAQCFIRANARRNAINRQADAIVITAVRKYNSYVEIGREQVARQAARVALSRALQQEAQAAYTAADAALTQCVNQSSNQS